MSNINELHSNIIEAAGGVLWRDTSSGRKIAIIHRPRYDDWSLPKGKRESGESWSETAQREVFEETGCQVILGDFIGCASYSINHDTTTKLVLFWHMFTGQKGKFQPNNEVDRLKWVSPQKALKLLNYEDERLIIEKATKELVQQSGRKK